MRITKQIAKDVAEKLLIKKLEHWDTLKNELFYQATLISISKINPEIIAFQKKYHGYVKKVKAVQFMTLIDGVRKELDQINTDVDIPCSTSSYYRTIEISVEEFNFFDDLTNKVYDAKKDYLKSLAIVEQTIFNLRTAIQLQKHFPEAYALVPKETNGTMLPMINLDQVRALVSSN